MPENIEWNGQANRTNASAIYQAKNRGRNIIPPLIEIIRGIGNNADKQETIFEERSSIKTAHEVFGGRGAGKPIFAKQRFPRTFIEKII